LIGCLRKVRFWTALSTPVPASIIKMVGVIVCLSRKTWDVSVSFVSISQPGRRYMHMVAWWWLLVVAAATASLAGIVLKLYFQRQCENCWDEVYDSIDKSERR
jgi:hypothetical protein